MKFRIENGICGTKDTKSTLKCKTLEYLISPLLDLKKYLNYRNFEFKKQLETDKRMPEDAQKSALWLEGDWEQDKE